MRITKANVLTPHGEARDHERQRAAHIAAFLHRFSLPYHGSGLPAAIGQVMEQLLKPKRKAFTLKNRQEQYHLQGGALRTLCF